MKNCIALLSDLTALSLTVSTINQKGYMKTTTIPAPTSNLEIKRDAYFDQRYLIIKNGWEIVTGFDSLEEAIRNYPDLKFTGNFDFAE